MGLTARERRERKEGWSSSLRSLLAAHKAASPAGESPAMVNNDEPFSHNQRGPLGDPAHESLVVKALARAGRATPPGRSIKRTLQLRYAILAGSGTRGNVVVEPMQKRRRPMSTRKTSSSALVGTTGVRVTARGERTGRVNWGPSAAGGLVPQLDGIIHKPSGGRQRRRCGHSKPGADRTIEPDGEPRATGPAVVIRSSRCRLDASPTTDKTPGNEIPTVTAYKRALARARRWPRRQAGLKPYWGKPAVRNFRGGRGNEVHGLMTICHTTRKGGYVGSH
jgi:hypothetical protein